ncbi:cytochrome P450 [Kitasatospora sp. SolWspMP-SS2h]|uniref:cytochrome P450 n=1 Tax=Kitasatospora sp. SolWspMP-SS2h TaxID=1305729 RepID=UPI000DB9A8D0|nr:cytochrome P450 [Kitasatospora sp. SolWspMP-SS2h]RAJ46943.1 cytochrome P450 [Kitasatospora sp. SolWspMP-SS2h]
MRSAAPPAVAPVASGRLPLLGHLPHLAVRRVEFLQSVRGQGDIVRIFLGNRPVFVLNSPEAVHEVMVTQGRKFGKGLLFDVARPFIGNGIITSERDLHRRQRRALQPAFRRESIAACVGTMAGIAQEQVAAWRPGEVIAMDLVLRRMMTAMLVATLFSAERPDGAAAVAALGERVAEHLTTVMRGVFVGTVLPARIAASPVLGHRRYLAAAAALRELADTAVRQARQDPAGHGDLLSAMFAPTPGNPDGMTDTEARDELLSLLMAGAETTSTTLAWALHELGRHPDITDRIKAECDALPADALPGAAALPFTDRFLREVLRLHQPSWILMRRALEPVRVRGVELPAGAELIYSAVTMHRDPAHFPDPLRFDPDRWLDRPEKDLPPGAYVPFALGSRKCIGDHFAMTEMLVVLRSIVSRWRPHPVRGHRVRPVVQALIRPDALPMRVSPWPTR